MLKMLQKGFAQPFVISGGVSTSKLKKKYRASHA